MVEHYLTDGTDLKDKVKMFSEKISGNDFPSDGLVLVLDDIAYGRSLGRTAKFPRDSMAFKWADEEAVTHLTDICWSASRTGLINPVAVFEPVELEGTTVSRASIHNVSIVRSLRLWDTLTGFTSAGFLKKQPEWRPLFTGNNQDRPSAPDADHCVSTITEQLIEYILIQPFKCLFHPGKRQCQIHADMARTMEGSAVLPDDSDLHTGSLQLIDRLPMLLTPLCTVQKQHIGSFRL